jgi:hypothetical protein
MNEKNKKALESILSGKSVEKGIQVGYTGTPKNTRPSGEGKEIGEEWQVDGKTWVKTKTGVERKSAVEGARVPMFCPKCEKIMKGTKDTNAYYSHGTCLNCLVDYHDELRKEGTLEEVMFRKRLLNAKSWLREQYEQLNEFISKENYNPEFVLSDGTIEKWEVDGNISSVIDSYKEWLQNFDNDLQNSIKEYETKYQKTID